MTVAEQIKTYRTKKNLTQAAFATMIGVSQGQIGHWENDRQKISAVMALKIERASTGELTARELRPDLPWFGKPSINLESTALAQGAT